MFSEPAKTITQLPLDFDAQRQPRPTRLSRLDAICIAVAALAIITAGLFLLVINLS